jgi:mono/diheme cytochrome c family protein
VDDLRPRWLDATFAISAILVVSLFGVAAAREAKRPVHVEQRVVPALGLVDRCEACHDAASHLGDWLTSHPVEKFGCTACHGGQGLATDKASAHLPQPDWEHPLLSPAEREAACGRCHLGQEVQGAPALSRGRRALAERGCAGCHELPGLPPPVIAPDLDGLADKVKPAWVRAWLADPGKLDDRHVMPRFELGAERIDALVAFLFSLPGPALAAPGPEGDAERGKKAVARRRCATCHRIEGRGGVLGPPLDTAGAKLDPRWLASYLAEPHRLRPRTRMPAFRLEAQEIADIVAYAAEQWVPDTAELPWSKEAKGVDASLAAKGKALFVELGCRGCHTVAGIPFARVGVALGAFGDRHLVDLPGAGGAGAPRDLAAWAARKITAPRGFDANGARPSQMPAFAIQPDEAAAIGVAIAAMRAAPPPAGYGRGSAEPPSFPVPPGATGRLVDRFRCATCHRIGGAGGDVSRVPLDGAAARLERPWLDHFLREPTTVRMDQAERMPVLGLDEGEAQKLASWIEATLGDARVTPEPPATPDEIALGRRLFGERGCPTCHMAEGAGTMKGPVLDGARDRLSLAYVGAILRLGPALVPEGRHPPAVHPPAEARAMAAYVTSLAAPAPAAPPEPPKKKERSRR